eukprot:1151157-Pelagomonas_calceolata.AAC.2
MKCSKKSGRSLREGQCPAATGRAPPRLPGCLPVHTQDQAMEVRVKSSTEVKQVSPGRSVPSCKRMSTTPAQPRPPCTQGWQQRNK